MDEDAEETHKRICLSSGLDKDNTDNVYLMVFMSEVYFKKITSHALSPNVRFTVTHKLRASFQSLINANTLLFPWAKIAMQRSLSIT